MRADLHVHSAYSSDGLSTLEELCQAAQKQGLCAIAVSDHDACTDVSGSYPVLLIPAVEITSQSGHILGLFLESPIEEAFFAEPPTPAEAIAKIREYGGLAVLAHPYAPQKLTEDAVRALQFDAIECENARSATKTRLYNHKARALAEQLSLPMLGGSDAHCADEIGGCVTELDCEACTLSAIKEAVRSGNCQPVFVHACRRKYKGLSQWEKYKHGSFNDRIWALGYLAYCLLADLLKRR